MSCPLHSGYYGSSTQPSGGNSTGYSSSSRDANNSIHSGSINHLSNTAHQSSYNSSGYDWPSQSQYSNTASTDRLSDAYPHSTEYGYQRNNAYGNQATSVNAPYSQDHYGHSPVVQGQQPAHTQNEGLSNLAYASGLKSASSRSNMTSNNRPYERTLHHQSQVQSPNETQARYSINSPPTATSYPMRQQASSSSTSSNQLAMDAAAALAGAVGRRNASSVQHPGSNTTRDASGASHVRSTAASPQTNITSRSNPPYVSSQQLSQPQQRSMPSQYPAVTSQTAQPVATTPPQVSSQMHAAGTTRQDMALQKRHATRSPPRSVRQTGSNANLVSTAHESDSGEYSQRPETQENAPTFIDPTSIFDPYAQERERRRQAAERAAIEAKQKAEEEAKQKAVDQARAEHLRQQRQKEAAEAAEHRRTQDEAEAHKRQAAARSALSNTRPGGNSKALTSSSASAARRMPMAQNEEERMAAELKAMMEKMKAFQTKDPSLFKKLWEDMRKPGASVSVGGIETPSPQLAAQTLPATEPQSQEPTQQVGASTASNSTPRSRSKKAQVSPDGQQLRLNGYSVVVEDNPDGLPDLGRFPAERRIRQTYNKDRSSKGGEKIDATGNAQLVGTPPTNVQPTRSPASSKTAKATPAALSDAFSGSTAQSNHGTQAAPKPASGTIWPLEKRNALTSTALKALKAIPDNANVALTEGDLHKILESNPSYIDLCQKLEAKGLKFHRGHFARELLNSVPDLKGGTPSSQPTPSSLPAPGQAVQVVSGGSPIGTQPSPSVPPTSQQQQPTPPPHAFQHPYSTPLPQHYAPAPNQYHPHAYGPPPGHFAHPPPRYSHATSYPPGQGARPATYPMTPRSRGPLSRPEPAPGSKEAAARKRDFSELIDLTELGNDDNYVVPDKQPRLDSPDSGDEMTTDPFQAYQKQHQATPVRMNTPSRLLAPPGGISVSSQLQGQASKQEQSTETKGQRRLLAKSLDKDESLKKQYYDPKTVARDILIATGRHPSERPLNVHLAGMLGRYIELDSDVNTLEWDEVDPGGPRMPKVEIVDVPASKPRFKLGYRGVKRGRKAGSLSLIDKTRRPDKERRTNGVIPPVTQPAPDTTITVGTVSSPLKSQQQKGTYTKPASKLHHSLLASDEQATPAQFDPTKPPQIQSDRPLGDGRTSQRTAMNLNQETSSRRRGRPPGSKNKVPSVAAMKAQANEIKVNVPLRDATPSTKDKFKCKWKKCSTVLHNLDTLRKHIGRVHRPSTSDATNEGYTCWWKKCRYLKQDEATGDWITTKAFDHREDWLKHIEKEHVTPIAMRWGDGPPTSHVDPTVMVQDRKIYLSNAAGLETTPFLELTNNLEYPSDTLNLTELDHRSLSTHNMTDKQKSEEAAYIYFMRAHGIYIRKHEESRESSKEVLRSLAKRKETIGPGMDKGGCTLVNEAMRETFEQNPGIRRIVGMND